MLYNGLPSTELVGPAGRQARPGLLVKLIVFFEKHPLFVITVIVGSYFCCEISMVFSKLFRLARSKEFNQCFTFSNLSAQIFKNKFTKFLFHNLHYYSFNFYIWHFTSFVLTSINGCLPFNVFIFKKFQSTFIFPSG